MKTKRDEVLDDALAAFANPQAFTAESNAVVEQVKPLLAGKGAAIQGAILADLVAIWIGGHIVPGDPAATGALQADMLEIHRQIVADLVAYYKAKPPGR